MKPVKFDEINCIFAEDQPDYTSVPAHKDVYGVVTTCWELSKEELTEIFKSNRLYLQILTFNKPLQPINITVNNPLRK